MKNLDRIGFFRLFLVTLVLFLVLHLFGIFLEWITRPEKRYENFLEQIKTAERLVVARSSYLAKNLKDGDNYWKNQVFVNPADQNKPYQISDFLFKNDSLIWWNDNQQLVPEKFLKTSSGDFHACRQNNGWSLYLKTAYGEYTIGTFVSVKKEYSIVNNYLENHFSPGFSLSPDVSITLNPEQYPVCSESGNYLFSLDFTGYDSGKSIFSRIDHPWRIIAETITGFLFFLANFLLYYTLFYLCRNPRPLSVRFPSGFILFTVLLLLARFLQSFFSYPSLVYHTDLFRPVWFSYSAVLPSPGDFLLLLMIISAIAYQLYRDKSLLSIKTHIKWAGNVLFAGMVLLLFGFHLAAAGLIRNLLLNSSIPMNLQNIAEMTMVTLIGFGIVFLININLWLLSVSVMKRLEQFSSDKWRFGVAALIAIFGYIILYLIDIIEFSYLPIASFIIFSAIYWVAFNNRDNWFTIQQILLLILFFSGFNTVVMNEANLKKTNDKIALMALKLASGHNPNTEQRYDEIAKKLTQDIDIKKYIFDSAFVVQSDSLSDLIKKRFSGEYWNKYNIQVTLCRPGGKLLIQPGGYLDDCQSYFKSLIDACGIPTQSRGLYYLDYGYDLEYYLGIIHYTDPKDSDGISADLCLELTLSGTAAEPGYPSLLLDKERDQISGLQDYSYAIYRYGNLIHSVGNLLYPLELPYSPQELKQPEPISVNGEIHHHFGINPDSFLLIGYKSDMLLSLLTPFSYLFILFALVAAVSAVISFSMHGMRTGRVSLKMRLQFLLAGLILVTMTVIGVIQIGYITKINRIKNLDYLREKGFSVRTEIQHKFGTKSNPGEIEGSDIENFLIKLANVFFTDINLFDPDGKLMASSRIRIFRTGLIAPLISPQALKKLITEKKPMVVLDENIGALAFSSAYLPLYNDKGKLLCYINLPFFSRQDRLKSEIVTFLVTFANIYIFLILAGVFITVLLSNYIAAPFVMLSGKMASFRLGKRNEKIVWKNRDEVGELVEVYNKLVDELEQSAQQLATSERESAWRTMARQVAHEIKNPLTPMKLSAQYLQKLSAEGVPDLEKRVDRFTQTLVEQIDALAAIASDFSSFARMPNPEPTEFDLAELVRRLLDGYPDTENVTYLFTSYPGDYQIIADRTGITRMMSNLLNNATQSLIPGKPGIVSVTLTQEQEMLRIMVNDNGEGISADRAEKIFQPDFTTRSGGMGLGLAIVKGIVDDFKGEITFSSELGKGTCFTVKMPAKKA